jgi:protein gp37
MAERSAIAWTDATFNPVWGCQRVSPACDHCYAAAWAQRLVPDQALWDGAERAFRTFGDHHWNEPLRWEKRAEHEGRRIRVFCASMADVFDKDWPADVRPRLWDLIAKSPHLDWQLLTKRIGNVRTLVPGDWFMGEWPRNVWLGITVIDQAEFDRDVPKLLEHNAAVRWLSIEPMLGAINMSEFLWGPPSPCAECPKDIDCECGWKTRRELGFHGIDWVVAGGESGRDARPLEAQWVSDLADECRNARIPFFMKQLSEANWPTFKDFESFPADLRVRQWPAEQQHP